jgi:hypothetical protein
MTQRRLYKQLVCVSFPLSLFFSFPTTPETLEKPPKLLSCEKRRRHKKYAAPTISALYTYICCINAVEETHSLHIYICARSVSLIYTSILVFNLPLQPPQSPPSAKTHECVAFVWIICILFLRTIHHHPIYALHACINYMQCNSSSSSYPKFSRMYVYIYIYI